MPNGDPDWVTKELPELEKFFRKISNVLEDFAKEHNLMIDKYYHQGPDWTFRFRHPKGGKGLIEVKKFEDDNVLIGTQWQIADYDTCTLYMKQTKQVKSSLEHDILKDNLGMMLRLILSWENKELIPSKAGQYYWWKDVSKKDFERENKKCPIAKP